jgi:SAM-dependent methyltransferase
MGSLGSGRHDDNGGPGVGDGSGVTGRGAHDRDRYFARERLRWLRRCLDELGERPASLLDFGCRDGATSADFFAHLAISSLVGVDVSATASPVRQSSSIDDPSTFVHVADYRATGSMDLAVTHDVIPRMPPRDRAAAAVLVFRSLKSGGLFAFWDRNPWNPSVRLALYGRSNGGSNDRSNGAGSPLTPADARRLLRGVGFDIVHTTSTSYFPRTLTLFRPLEPVLAPLPLGKQYMVLARKP